MKSICILLVITTTYFNISAQVRDVENNVYTTCEIGDQTWMTKNLTVSKFKNGDPIPEARTQEEWVNAAKEGTPVWSDCDNNPINGQKYGKLYNWYAVNDSRGLAPEGFHIPTSIEWNNLIETLGGAESCVMKIRSISGWKDPEPWGNPNQLANDYNGNNLSGFNALPAGFRNNLGTFILPGVYNTYWWTATEYCPISAWFVTFVFVQKTKTDGSSEYIEELIIDRYGKQYGAAGKKVMGFSVRCLKN